MENKTIVDFVNRLAESAREERDQADTFLLDLYFTGKIDGFENAASVCADSNMSLPVANTIIMGMKDMAEKHKQEADARRSEESSKRAAMYRGKMRAYSVVLFYLQQFDASQEGGKQ